MQSGHLMSYSSFISYLNAFPRTNKPFKDIVPPVYQTRKHGCFFSRNSDTFVYGMCVVWQLNCIHFTDKLRYLAQPMEKSGAVGIGKRPYFCNLFSLVVDICWQIFSQSNICDQQYTLDCNTMQKWMELSINI